MSEHIGIVELPETELTLSGGTGLDCSWNGCPYGGQF